MTTRITRLVAICLALVTLPGLAFAATEYVTNGGLETGDLTSWQTTGTVTVDNTAPHAGSYNGVIGAGANMSQALTISPASCPLARIQLAVKGSGEPLIGAGWDNCGAVVTDHSSGASWQLVESVRFPCGDPGSDFSLSITNDSGTDSLEIDSISVQCVNLAGGIPSDGLIVGDLESGGQFYVSRSVTWGNLANFGILAAIFGVLLLTLFQHIHQGKRQ